MQQGVCRTPADCAAPKAEVRRGDLVRAYLATTYWVHTSRGVLDIRIGVRNPQLDGWLATRGAKNWAFITAWNPASRRTPAWRNRARQRALEHRLHAKGLAFLNGWGVGDDHAWPPEASALILGLSEVGARVFARRLAQNAIVAGTIRKPSRLVWCARTLSPVAPCASRSEFPQDATSTY